MNKGVKRGLVSVTVAALILGTIGTAAEAQVTRVSVSDRYEVSDKIVDMGWTTSDTVILASGENSNLVDALTVAPFAKEKDAPVVLTPPGKKISDAAMAKIKKLKATQVYIATGKGVITDDVIKQLNDNGITTVKRLGGANRYETAINIAKELGTVSKVVLASADDKHLIDSLSIASIAAIKGMPILLSDANKLPDAVKKYIQDMSIDTAYAMGGPTLLSDDLLYSFSGTKQRIYGSTRYDTNTETIKDFKGDSSIKFDKVYVTSGKDEDMIYPLVCAPLAARNNGVIVLSNDDISQGAEALLKSTIKSGTDFQIIGNERMIQPAVSDKLNAIQKYVTEKDIPLAVKNVSIINLKQAKIEFTKEVDKESAEDSGNYQVYDTTEVQNFSGKYNAVLQDDKKSVIVSLDGASDFALPNLSSAKVLVGRGIKDTYGNALTQDYTKENLDVKDMERPTLAKAEQIAWNKIRVRFTEPVKDATTGINLSTDEFQLDNGGATISKVEEDIQNSAVILTVGAALSSGPHVIKVNPTAAGNLCDFAGFKILQGATLDFKAIKDSTSLTATIESASQSSVVFKFSKPINNAQDSNIKYGFEVNGNLTQIVANNDQVSVSADRTEVTVNFAAAGYTIPLGNASFSIGYVYGSNNGTITDDYNNTLSPTVVTSNVGIDNIKPTVTVTLDPNKNDTIYVEYSEAVQGANETSSYLLATSDGDTLGCSVTKIDGTHYILNTSNPLGGSYSLKIRNIKDYAATPNQMDAYSKIIQIQDTVPPAFADERGRAAVLPSYYMKESETKVVTIYFTEVMNTSDLTDLKMYQSTSDSGANPISAIPAPNGESVDLTFNKAVTGNILVGQLRDKAGNKMSSLATTLSRYRLR